MLTKGVSVPWGAVTIAQVWATPLIRGVGASTKQTAREVALTQADVAVSFSSLEEIFAYILEVHRRLWGTIDRVAAGLIVIDYTVPLTTLTPEQVRERAEARLKVAVFAARWAFLNALEGQLWAYVRSLPVWDPAHPTRYAVPRPTFIQEYLWVWSQASMVFKQLEDFDTAVLLLAGATTACTPARSYALARDRYVVRSPLWRATCQLLASGFVQFLASQGLLAAGCAVSTSNVDYSPEFMRLTQLVSGLVGIPTERYTDVGVVIVRAYARYEALPPEREMPQLQHVHSGVWLNAMQARVEQLSGLAKTRPGLAKISTLRLAIIRVMLLMRDHYSTTSWFNSQSYTAQSDFSKFGSSLST